MKAKTSEAIKGLLKKVTNLRSAKSGINFNNQVRTMQKQLINKTKLINGDLLWAERAIKRAKELKTTLKALGLNDVASFKRVLEIYNAADETALQTAVETAKARMMKALEKCENDGQRAVVSEFYEVKVIREAKLKALIFEVLKAEGVVKQKAKKAGKVVNPTEVPAEVIAE